MSNAPACYHDTITQQLLTKGDAVAIEDIKLALKLKWIIQTGDDKDKEDNDEEETALSLNDTKVKCGRCGKKGHKAADC